MSLIACADNFLGPESFADVLHERRREAGLTQEELAQRAGCSRGALNRWENGHREPSGVYRLALRMALGLDENADGGFWRSDWS